MFWRSSFGQVSLCGGTCHAKSQRNQMSQMSRQTPCALGQLQDLGRRMKGTKRSPGSKEMCRRCFFMLLHASSISFSISFLILYFFMLLFLSGLCFGDARLSAEALSQSILHRCGMCCLGGFVRLSNKHETVFGKGPSSKPSMRSLVEILEKSFGSAQRTYGDKFALFSGELHLAET